MPPRSVLLWIASGAGFAAAGALVVSPAILASEANPAAQNVPESGKRAPVAWDPHPARPVVERARDVLARIDGEIRDYTATLVRRERYEGTLGDPQSLAIKVRHKPFSTYVNFDQANNPRVVELIYIDDPKYAEKNEPPHMFVHSDLPIFGRYTRMLNPYNKTWAMKGERRPMTDIGILNLGRWMLRDAEKDLQHADCKVRWVKDAKVDDRASMCVETVRPAPREDGTFHKTRFFVDDQLAVPIRFEAYDWPATADAEPELLEEYTYRNLRLNPGLDDRDFDYRNPEYGFPRSVRW